MRIGLFQPRYIGRNIVKYTKIIVEIFLWYFEKTFLKKLRQTLHYFIINSIEPHSIQVQLMSITPTMQITVKYSQRHVMAMTNFLL